MLKSKSYSPQRYDLLFFIGLVFILIFFTGGILITPSEYI